MESYDLYQLGNELRRKGDFAGALNAYTEAAEMDPEGPAAVAKEMLEEQFAFYYKDLYNP